MENVFFKLLDGFTPALAVIDTLARTLGGHDENGSGMRNFLDNAERLAEGLDCLVFVIHHEGNETGRPRGHTALPAGVVSQWHLKRQGLRCRLTCERAKDGPEGQTLSITLKPTEVRSSNPENNYGEGTLMVDKIEMVEADDHKGPRWKRAAEILVSNAVVTPSGRPGLPLADFQQALERYGLISGRQTGRLRKQWHDIKKTLVDRGLADIDGDLIALPSKKKDA